MPLNLPSVSNLLMPNIKPQGTTPKRKENKKSCKFWKMAGAFVLRTLKIIQRSSRSMRRKGIWVFSEFESTKYDPNMWTSNLCIYEHDLPKQELFHSHAAVLKLSGACESKHNILFGDCLHPKPSCHTSWHFFRMALSIGFTWACSWILTWLGRVT